MSKIKGFIEVTADEKYFPSKEKLLLAFGRFHVFRCKGQAMITMDDGQSYINLLESYEEVKNLIREAME